MTSGKQRGSKSFLRNKFGFLALFIVLGLLLVGRAFLPGMVKRYVVHTLNKIPGYHVHVEAIRINLWRGAYGIIGLNIVTTGGNVPIPFFSVREADLSIQWKELLHGALVGKIILKAPQLNFVSGASKAESQTSMDQSWQARVQELFPLQINFLKITNGSIHFRKFDANPSIDLYFDDVHALVQNLSNSRQKAALLLASLDADGKPMGQGRFNLHMDFNPLEIPPLFKLEAKVDDLQLPALNDFAGHYAGIAIKKGKMDVYSEIVAQKETFRGYVKPFLTELDFVDLEDKNVSMFKKIRGTVAEFFAAIFKNRNKESVASKIEFSGKFEDPEIRMLAKRPTSFIS
jgi:hypothetical protein